MKKDILEMQKVHLDNIINERKDGIDKEIEDKFILNYTYAVSYTHLTLPTILLV